jgi:glycosyltransferase involved in cell wall biosynthesis
VDKYYPACFHRNAVKDTQTMDRFSGPLRILHLLIALGETSSAYNEHCLPVAIERKISVCSYFKSSIVPPSEITLFEGNGSLIGFYRALKVALTQQHYDVVHAHSTHVALLFLIISIFFIRRFSLPATVYTVHTSFPTYKLRHKLMSIPVFAKFQKVVCCSESSFKSFPAFYKWLAGNRLCTVQNGLDITRVDRIAWQTQSQSREKSTFTIIAISRLVEIKSPYAILSVFQQSVDRNSRLIYIGDGPLRNSLITKSRAAGLENLTEFTGLIPREKVYEHLLGADLFLSTSRGEGLPVSVLEAMACRCPVVLSDIPPHREIAEGVDFIPLVEPDDLAGFVREIRRFREMSAAERAAIGEKCRKLVEERFNLDIMHTGYEKIYTQIIDQPPHSSRKKMG